jgi:hypothetical protein
MDTNHVPTFDPYCKGYRHPDDPPIDVVRDRALHLLRTEGDDGALSYCSMVFSIIRFMGEAGMRTPDQCLEYAEGLLWVISCVEAEKTGVMRHDA